MNRHSVRAFFQAALLVSTLSFAAFSEDAPVAKIGDKTYTEADIHREIGTSLYGPEQQVYDAKKAWLDRQSKEYLFNKAAQEAGLSRRDWEVREINGKIKAPTPQEVDKFMQSMKRGNGAMPSQQDVSNYLFSQRHNERSNELYQELLKKSDVQVFIKPPATPKFFTDADPSMGPADAPVTIVEFTDFQCPYCRKSQDTLAQVEKAYAGKLRVVARQYPLYFHPRAKPAAEAALCANAQGKFWPYREKLFKQLTDKDLTKIAKAFGLNTSKFSKCVASGKYDVTTDTNVANIPLYGGHAPQAILCAGEQGKLAEFRNSIVAPDLEDADFSRYAQEVGLNVGEFQKCYSEHRFAQKVDQDMAEGQSFGVQGTPHFFVNGRPISGAQPFEAFQQAIGSAAQPKK